MGKAYSGIVSWQVHKIAECEVHDRGGIANSINTQSI